MDFHEVREWLRDLGYEVEDEAMARFRVTKNGILVGMLLYIEETGTLRTNASLERFDQKCTAWAQEALAAAFPKRVRRASLAGLL